MILFFLIPALLIPAWGWADDKICFHLADGTCMEWDAAKKEFVNPREVIRPICLVPNEALIASNLPCTQQQLYLEETNEVIPASCVQRMREAMQWMAPMNRTYNENKRRDPYFDFEKQRREFEENSKKWEATMKDCVEGK